MDLEPWQSVLIAVVVLFLIWFAYVTRASGDADDGSFKARLHRAWRRIAFWAGDVRLVWLPVLFVKIPVLTWIKDEDEVTYEEFLDVMARMQAGDVFLSKHEGFIFSNTAIPGMFKHAGIVVEGAQCEPPDEPALCDVSRVRVVEAVSEGVVQHSPLNAMADKMILLRPRHMNDEERGLAVRKAKRFVGMHYDTGFDFNIEDELQRLELNNLASLHVKELTSKEELERFGQNMEAEFDVAFSCTETVAAAWWHKREDLRLYRIFKRGRNIIVADQFVNRGFEIVWTNVSLEEAAKNGLPEEGRLMFQEYWAKQVSHE